MLEIPTQSTPSIIGATDKRAALVAMFEVIGSSPSGRLRNRVGSAMQILCIEYAFDDTPCQDGPRKRDPPA